MLCAGLISGGAAVSGESGAQEAVNAEAPADDAVQPEVPAQPVEEAQQNTPAPEDTEGGGEAGQQQEETPDQQQEELYPEDDGNGEESVPSVSRPDAGSAESSAAPVGTTAEPLTVSVTTAMKYAFAGENALTFETQITGGTEPFETSYEIDRDGTPVWSAREYQPELTYMPEEAGGYELVLSVTDAAGQAASGRCAIPVAVRHEESPSDWEPALKEVRMTGRYAEDLLAIARTQLGYTESADNFIVTEEGARQGYTRYGQWQGDAYEPWDAAFAAFCLYYAGVRDVPADTKAEKWADELKRRGMYRDLTAENRPEEGDFLFTRDGEVTRIGLVEKTDDTGVTAIEGDVGGAVARVTYGWDDARLAGFGDPRTTLTDEAAGVTVTGIFPEGATLTVQLLAEDADGFTEAQDRIHAALSPLYDRYAVNLADVTETAVYVPSLTVNGEVVSPCKKVRVGVSACGGRFAGHGDVRVLTFSDEQTELLSAEEKDGGDGADAIVSASFRTDRLSEFALTAVAPDRLTMRRTAADGDAKVTVTYGTGAGVPESAELRVRQIRGDGDDADRAEYQKRQAEAAALLETEAGGENAASQPDTAASGSPGNAENADVSRQTDQNAENAAADQQADQNAENVAADQTEDSKEYAAYMEEVEAALASGRKVQMAKLFDITILDKEGNEVEPLTPVCANIEFVPKEVQEGTDLELYQFQTEGEKPQVMENVEVLTDDDNIVNGIEFETDGFSVYGIVGTEVLTGGVMTADGDSYSVTVKYDKYAEIPDDAVLVATEVQNSSRLYQSYMSEAEDALTSDSDAEISFARFFDVSIMADGEKIQPATPAEVIIDYNESQEITEGTEVSTLQFGDSVPATVDAAVSGTDTQVDGVSFQAEEVSVYGIVGTESITVPFTTGDGRTYEVTVDFDKDAGIPEDAQLKVSEVTEDNSKYDDYVEQAADAIDSRAEALNYIKLLNIEIVDENGDKVDLEAPVDVTIKLLDKEQNEEEQTQVVHFEGANEMPVVLDSSAEADTVSFSADGFSVYAIVYTVDFEYSVNGKMYQFSLPGGGFVSFTDLVEVLGIIGDTNSGKNGDENGSVSAENTEENAANEGTEENSVNSDTNTALTLGDVEVSEATRKFVEDVASVEFSSPELVDVSKVDADTTVGQIKESRGLECQYSAELTEAQIAEINAQTVEAGDWALISVQPFTSEETLTVTMKDGDQFVVRVTDAQISTHVITADGKDYIITVTYGSEAGIPDGAELTARELLPGTEEYEAHYTQMIAAVEGEVSDSDLDDEMNAAFAEAGLEVVNPQSAVEVAFARFFDISIWKDGAEIEPLTPVQVEIQYNEPVSVDSSAEAEVVHFAEDGIELIDPDTDLSESSGEGISSFTYQQSSFSISATLLKYTTGIQNGNYLIIRGVKDENNVEHWYALKADGSTIEVTKKGDTITRLDWYADDVFWTFTNAGNGQYYIQNRSNRNSYLVLFNNIVGNWDQLIKVEVPDGRRTVYLKNPDNTGLRFNGSKHQFFLGSRGDGKAEQVYLARLNSEIPQGRGYNLTPAGETDLGDLNAWKDKVENSKIIVDKTASVVDYDNRIYQIDLKALSDITIISNKIDLELIVDTSRSMYFPANLSPVSGYYFTSIMGNDSHSLEKQLSWLDKNQIYYFIGNGEQATVYALYYAASGTNLNDYTGDQCWKFVDASYMNPPDAGSMNQSDRLNRLVGARIDDLAYNICNQNSDGGGCRLYTASSSITRLAYLKEAVRIASEIVYAVDKDNRIGLVTFNSSAKDQGFYDYKNRTGLYGKINNISLVGGTRQDLGLETGKSQLDSNGRADAQKIAILITDGAPNMQDSNKNQIPSDTAWTMIGEKASALKGTNSSNAKLYTLGLSLDMVGGNNQRHLDGLASEEDGVTRHFNASNGPAIVRAVKDLIDTLMYDVTLEAEVTDVLDPAFYPVDKNGNPIAVGDYTDENGKRYNWSMATVDGAECWKITYYDQEVGRGEKNADNTIKTPGWQKSFYVKAKEDFLGGNDIETNRYKSSNNRVKPIKYVYKERGTNATKKVDPPSNAPWGIFINTPTVNVDELHLTEHSTEWTVYMGIEVKPEDQVKALWDEIKVKQVVKTNGTANNGTTITKGDKKWYSKTDTKDTAAPDKEYSSLPINRYFTDVDFNTLLNQLKTQDSAEKTINYTAYGHQPGTITVKLEKKIIDGAVDANVKAPGQHITDKDGTPAEKYTITVTYTPNKTDTGCNIGHVTTGTGQDEVKSANEHKINVFVKKLKLLKADQGGNTISSDSATFVLYRKATSDEIADESVAKTDLTGLSGKYVTVQTLTTNGGSVITGALPLLADNEPYYLVETKAPAGYIMLTEPLKVTVDMTDHNTWTKLADNSTSQTKPDPYVLSNWLQETTIKLLKLNDTAYDPTQTSTYNHSNDTTDASVTYQIINNAGYELPSTGGPGSNLLYLLGSLMLALGSAGLVMRKRRRVG
ncbi:VWA domain-containing protein [Chordicoccus furentiruminis]|uniref:VWA domain-containing protein n=1 Tax=Chordicoccus furentiruminis TaxID=2709410 RepID=UPI0023A8F49B|nr:VWA domain-containing protein [Chordicoccus furentiruminis]